MPLAPLVAASQIRTADPVARGARLTDFPRIVKVADNVYGYEEIRQPGFTTVSLFVVGRDGVLIPDGKGNAAATQTMLDRIRTLTTLPIRWYVVGSDHGDHTAGNSVLRRIFATSFTRPHAPSCLWIPRRPRQAAGVVNHHASLSCRPWP